MRKRIEETKEIIILGADSSSFFLKEHLEQTLRNIEKDDRIIGVAHRSGYRPKLGWGMADEPNEEEHYNYWTLIVLRWRDETDDDYYKRIKAEEDIKKRTEELDRLTYLRLKAKYES